MHAMVEDIIKHFGSISWMNGQMTAPESVKQKNESSCRFFVFSFSTINVEIQGNKGKVRDNLAEQVNGFDNTIMSHNRLQNYEPNSW
jgi:hypothetical protein